MAKQTIDGVPRDLLERILHGCMFSLSRQQYDELRALLDNSQHQGEPVATEHCQNKINHLKQLLRNVRATLHFSPEDVLAIDAALMEDDE